MKRSLEITDRVLARPAAGAILLIGLAAVYVSAYFGHSLFPGFVLDGQARGWLTWTDQSRYLEESLAIAELRLNETSYFYPLGYPLLGALFVKWMPNNAFFVPNLLFVVAAAMVWWRLAQRWLSRTAALLVGILFVLTHPWLIAQTMVVPWNTIPTQFALLAGIAIVLERSDSRSVWWLATLAAFTYLVRPIDAVGFAPLLVFATLRLPTWGERIVMGAAGVAIVASAVLTVGLFNLWLLGQWQTMYEIVSTRNIGFFAYPMSYKFFWLFVDGQPLFAEAEPALLFRYPWLFLVIPAVLFLIKQESAAGVAVLTAIGFNIVLYVNYNDLLPSDIYRFTLIHYLSWAFPLLFLLAAAAFGHVRRSRSAQVGLGLTVIAAVVCVGLSLEPEPIEVRSTEPGAYGLPTTRPLLIEFPGVPMARITEVHLDGRTLVEYSEYLVPYVPSDLRLLLGTRTQGAVLTFSPEGHSQTAPLFSVYRWKWRPQMERLSFTNDRAIH